MDSTLYIQLVVAALTVLLMLGILFLAKSIQLRRIQRELASRPAGKYVVVEIPDRILPMERASKYERPLDQELKSRGFGEASGGGTQMSKNGTVDWIDLDVYLYETTFADGLQCAIKKLLELGAPPNSRLKYQIGTERITRRLVEN